MNIICQLLFCLLIPCTMQAQKIYTQDIARLTLESITGTKNNDNDLIDAYKTLFQQYPENKDVQFWYARLLIDNDQIMEGITVCQTILAHDPTDDSMRSHLISAYLKLGDYAQAHTIAEDVLKRLPDNAAMHCTYASIALTLGDFENGWREHEWRLKTISGGPSCTAAPFWDGSSLHGKSILILAEQGLGDTLQFIRYAKILKDQGAYIICQVQSPLIPLLSLCPYIDHLDKLHAPITKNIDFYIPLMSIPYVCKTRFDTIPADIPYLYSNAERDEYWRQQLSFDQRFKIGVCWQGTHEYPINIYWQHTKDGMLPAMHMAISNKPIPLNAFECLSLIPNVHLYSLQKGLGSEQLETITFDITVFNESFDKTYGSFIDTASVMKQLGLVITVDTSVAHLAGGLGIPVFLLLPHNADWRWFIDRTDSPWYPTMHIIRQKKNESWECMMQRVASIIETITTHQINLFSIPISYGELIDKMTIQSLKKSRILDIQKWFNVAKEFEILKHYIEQLPSSTELDELISQLHHINGLLWDVEDGMQQHERNDIQQQYYIMHDHIEKSDNQILKDAFAPLDSFIQLARQVYLLNNERIRLKYKINTLLGSSLIEEKSHLRLRK